MLQFAKENPTWVYDRIADALANIGHKVSDQAVGNVLKGHGIEPGPGTQTNDDLVDIPQGALGPVGSH